MELFRSDVLDVKISQSCGRKKHRATENEQKHWESVAREAAKEIRESRIPFEGAIAQKTKQITTFR